LGGEEKGKNNNGDVGDKYDNRDNSMHNDCEEFNMMASV
jgi:hypothetical protein